MISEQNMKDYKNLANSEYSDEELIDLYLQGEISPEEQATLFHKLQSDSYLQSSMQQSILMKTAIEHELSRTRPSMEAKRRTFLAAGLMIPDLASATLTGAAQSFLASKIFLGTMGLLVGVLSTSALFLALDREEIKVADKENVPILYSQIDEQPLVVEMERPLANASHFTQSESTADLGQSFSSIDKTRQTSIGDKANEDYNPYVTSNDSSNPVAPSHSVDSYSLYQDWSRMQLTPSDSQNSVASPIGVLEVDKHIGFITDRFSEGGFIDFFDENLSNFHISVFGMNSLMFFNEMDADNGILPVYSNLGASLEYSLDESQRLIIAAATEKFPLFRIAGESQVPEQVIAWAGLGYRYAFNQFDLGYGFVPFSQMTLGATEFGLLAKGALGITYTPERRVSMSVALDVTGLTLRNSSGSLITGKTGAMYILSYNF